MNEHRLLDLKDAVLEFAKLIKYWDGSTQSDKEEAAKIVAKKIARSLG